MQVLEPLSPGRVAIADRTEPNSTNLVIVHVNLADPGQLLWFAVWWQIETLNSQAMGFTPSLPPLT